MPVWQVLIGFSLVWVCLIIGPNLVTAKYEDEIKSILWLAAVKGTILVGFLEDKFAWKLLGQDLNDTNLSLEIVGLHLVFLAISTVVMWCVFRLLANLRSNSVSTYDPWDDLPYGGHGGRGHHRPYNRDFE